jgi:autotransporter-associated beta strand protein
MKMHYSFPGVLPLAIATAAVLCCASTASATLRIWSGLVMGDGRWSTAGNWQNNSPPVAGDDLQFPLGQPHEINNSDDYTNGTTFNSITFVYSGGGGASGYTLAGNSIALNAGISAVNNSSLGFSDTVENALLLNSNQTFSVGGLDDFLYLKGPINLNGKGLTFDVAATSQAQVQAVISGSGALLKSSPGTLLLFSNNIYTGSTTLNGGTLEIDGSQPASPVLLNAGTLTGKGTVGTITCTGSGGPGSIVLDPGGTSLTMTCSNVSLNAATTFTATLYASGVYNQLNVHGSVALNNATLSVTLGSAPAVGQSFVIIANDGADPVSGTFSGLPEETIFSAGGLLFQITYAGFGNDVVLTRYGLRTVTNTADSGAGSLRAALAAAADGDTVNFAPNVTGTIKLTSGELLVTKSINISGPGPAVLAVDGNAATRVFHVTNAANAVIVGLTITNGMAPDVFPVNGGGIWVDASTLTLSNCSVSGNYFNGIYNDHSALILVNCTVSHNQVTDGSGGGIFNYGLPSNATVTAIGCTFSYNTASGATSVGGAVFNDGNAGSATLLVSNSTFTGNVAPEGGAIYHAANSPSGPNTLIVRACTFGGNSSPGGGSAIVMDGALTARLGNTILRTTTGVTIVNNGGSFTSDGYNLSGDNGGGFLTNATDQINTDPLLGPLVDNGGPTLTHALLPGSPAIDRGNSFGLTTDQRGEPRPFDFASITNAAGGDGSDIGAFEVDRPRLNIQQLGNAAVLSWPSYYTNLTLQSSTNLGSASNWVNASGSAVVIGNQYWQTNSPISGAQFYRLRGN